MTENIEEKPEVWVIPASTESVAPIYTNHIQMSLGAGQLFFDLRTMVPNYPDDKRELRPGIEVHIDSDPKHVPVHTRIVMPIDTALSLRNMLERSIIPIEQKTHE